MTALLPYAQDFEIPAGADWQRIIRVFAAPDTVSPRVFVPMTDAVMEIRNASRQLLIRLDTTTSRVTFMEDGSLLLHLLSPDTLALGSVSYPGTYLVGNRGVGKAFSYDLFVTWMFSGLVDKLFQGFVHVDPTFVTQPTSA